MGVRQRRPPGAVHLHRREIKAARNERPPRHACRNRVWESGMPAPARDLPKVDRATPLMERREGRRPTTGARAPTPRVSGGHTVDGIAGNYRDVDAWTNQPADGEDCIASSAALSRRCPRRQPE